MLNSRLNDCDAFAQTQEIASSFSRDPPPGSASGDWSIYLSSFSSRVSGGVNFLNFSALLTMPKPLTEGTGKSGSYGMWNHPRGHVWNVFVRPASS